jgi:hypothetical protein
MSCRRQPPGVFKVFSFPGGEEVYRIYQMKILVFTVWFSITTFASLWFGFPHPLPGRCYEE